MIFYIYIEKALILTSELVRHSPEPAVACAEHPAFKPGRGDGLGLLWGGEHPATAKLKVTSD